MIIPPTEFPYVGYQVSRDESWASTGWIRTFRSQTADYFFISVAIFVGRPDYQGTSAVAEEDCSYADSLGRPVTSTSIRAEVVGEGAKACRTEIGSGIHRYLYVTANRNVAIYVESNPRYFEVTDAVALRDLVNVARRQLQIVDRVAPR